MKLSEITSPADIKNLSEEELETLAEEIREKIISTVAVNGGHLASNLGAVELTIALHRAFDCPKDKIVFDVGHQCYAHKLLTGRYEAFSTLRTMDGICGFPRRQESPYDSFDTGHASTAISAVLGIARARDIMGTHFKVAAVVGDGALTGGMCYEALNDAGSRGTPMLVILNDNGMSISRNVGAVSRQLTRLRISRGWIGTKKNVAEALKRIPVCGKPLFKSFERIKNSIRNVLIRDKFFTALGFQYFGPIDGHDIQGMEKVFCRLAEMERPVVVHIVTKKGQGFLQAEEKPEKYHGVAPFVLDNGKMRGETAPSLGKTAGEYLKELAGKDKRICAVTAAMTDSVGLGGFAAEYPNRLFDVGIAEEHAVTLAAGMAVSGLRPFAAIYETFMQRAYDQIAEDVCLQQLPVCLMMDRAGLGGEDGATHHGIIGVSMLRSIPNIAILAPCCEAEMRAMIDWALLRQGPVAIRYPRSAPEIPIGKDTRFKVGKWTVLRSGQGPILLASSSILAECLEAAELLAKMGIDAEVVNASSIRPLDEEYLKRANANQRMLITAEEHVLAGGFGSAVAEYCAREHLSAPKAMIGFKDAFVPHGSRKKLLQSRGMDAEGIAEQVRKAVKQ
ncbi:MAG: 1-deoxy-D-xylulose-5-phosphate synthase [Clostridia bacterium]|nr:1-deoxy-D-xylulose-5-phosphate synthase [Clostridia bacterium]